jgi:hypothetical protein
MSLTDNGAIYLQRYGRGARPQSFDVKGVHLSDLSFST